jgi:hypothetical protein
MENFTGTGKNKIISYGIVLLLVCLLAYAVGARIAINQANSNGVTAAVPSENNPTTTTFETRTLETGDLAEEVPLTRPGD